MISLSNTDNSANLIHNNYNNNWVESNEHIDKNAENDMHREKIEPANARKKCFNSRESQRYVLSIIDAPDINSKKRHTNQINSTDSHNPRSDQTSLVIVFDATASMSSSLVELRSSARNIINKFKSKENNPIYNYIFVPFRDPGK